MDFNKKGALTAWIIIILLAIIAVSLVYINLDDDRVIKPPRETSGRDQTQPPKGDDRTPPAQQPPPTQQPSVPSTANFVYTFNQLKSGDLNGKIIHCSGPLFTVANHVEYNKAFPTTKSYMMRSDINLGDDRFTKEKMVQTMTSSYNNFPNEIPLVSILYTKSVGQGEGYGLDKEVLAGQYDDYLLLLADMIKNFNRPVFVRIASEFNGKWSGYHKETFADSYRYIVNFFKAQGVDNAIYSWNYMPLNQQFDYMSWYPGDDYVDWWGVEFFDNHVTQPVAKSEQKRFIDDAKAHGKPVYIPESGPATYNINDVATWQKWFVPYFNFINDNTNVKGFCYSNEDFTKTTSGIGWLDVRLSGTPIAPLYQQELKKPQYLHQQ